MKTVDRSRQPEWRFWLILVVVSLLAAVLRFSVIGKGLPYTYYPDEPHYVDIVQRMFLTGDPNPGFFFYPTLFFLLNALAYVPYTAIGYLAGVLNSPSDIQGAQVIVMGVGYTPLPSAFWMGRSLTAVFGVAAVAMTGVLGRRLTGDWRVGALASLAVAFSPTHAEYSRYMFPHVILTFFLLVTFWAIVRVFQRGSWIDYVLGGIGCGLAASTMYHGGLIGATLIVGHMFKNGWRSWRDVRLFTALALTGITFVLLNPFMLLDAGVFFRDSRFIISHYMFASGGTSAAGMGRALEYYLGYSWTVEGPVLLVSTLEFVRGLLRRDRARLLVFGFSVPYFLVISSATARNARTFLPLIPFLALSAACLLWSVIDLAWSARKANRLGVVTFVGAVAIVLGTITWPVARSVQDAQGLATIDSRETARAWIEANLPQGSRIALEAYSPYADPNRFQVQGVVRLSDQNLEWYLSEDVDYLVFSQGMFARFFAEPDLYAAEIARYEALFTTFTPVKIFADGDYEIRIYSTAP